MEHALGRHRKRLDVIHKSQGPVLMAISSAVKNAFLKIRKFAIRFPRLFESLFARVYREVEIFEQRSETAGRAEAAVVVDEEGVERESA